MLESTVMNIELRLANSEDVRFYWEVNNHPSVRASAVSQETIPWDSHQVWFEGRLQSQDHHLFVVVAGGERVGALHLSPHGHGHEVTVALAPARRGAGLGSGALQKIPDAFPYVEAVVRSDNWASRRAFEKAGFVRGARVLREGLWLQHFVRGPVAPELSIAGRGVGDEFPVYVIAELSANHHGDLGRAKAIIEAAADSGADAIKLQTYTADTMTLCSDNEPFQIKGGTLWDGRTLHALYEDAMTPWEWHPELVEHARSVGLDWFSSPFDESAVDFLEALDMPVHKVASFEIGHIPLLRKIAATGKPVIMSTGIAADDDIQLALRTLRQHGAGPIALLKCTSAYPASPDDANLAHIPHYRSRYDVVAGLSDHTLGTAVPVAAVALGAKVVEKHLTLSRADTGPDSAFSLEPHEFSALVSQIRIAERSIGSADAPLTKKQIASQVFARSIFVTQAIRAGETFTHANLRIVRPGHGLHPKHLDEILGRVAAADLDAAKPLNWDGVAS